jgi:hypothetical protein
VNFTQVPLSCSHNQPSAMARSIPRGSRRRCRQPPETARSLDVDPTVLHGFDVVCDFDDLARGDIRIGEGTSRDELHAVGLSCFVYRAQHDTSASGSLLNTEIGHERHFRDGPLPHSAANGAVAMLQHRSAIIGKHLKHAAKIRLKIAREVRRLVPKRVRKPWN